MKHIFQGLKIQGKMQLSRSVITFQFFMLWRGRTNRAGLDKLHLSGCDDYIGYLHWNRKENQPRENEITASGLFAFISH